MEIKRVAIAGTMESSDLMVTIEPRECSCIEIDLKSSVETQFGREIRLLISKTLQDLSIASAKVTVIDKGALDCTIRARLTTAVYRACEQTDYSWAVNGTEGVS